MVERMVKLIELNKQKRAYLKYVLKIALSCYMAVLLCSALFVSPLTSLSNYAHTHTDGSNIHLHSVQAILGSSLLGLAVTVVWLEPNLFIKHYESFQQLQLRTIDLAHNSRAPPTSI